MGANTEALREPRQVRLPAWIAVGTALALMAALVVVTSSDRDTTTPAREQGITVGSVAGSPDDVAEIASLKTARVLGTAFRSSDEPATGRPVGLANRGPARRFLDAATGIAWPKAKMANPFGRHS